MDAMESGTYNVAVGRSALSADTNGNYNVAVGRSLQVSTGIGYNTAVGHDALKAVTSGYSNVAVGTETGNTITTGTDNTCIGRLAQVSSVNANYETCLAAGQSGKGNGTTFIRGGAYQSDNSSTWSTTSDIRIKKNVVDNTTGLDTINQIRVRNFEYKTPDEIDYTEFVEGTNPQSIPVDKTGVQLGVVAQEIEEILPDIVKTESTGVKTVDPDNITWYLVNAVKELSAENTALKARLDAAGL